MTTTSTWPTVSSLVELKSLQLEVLAGAEGLSGSIKDPAVQKPGLALAGHIESIHRERIQVVGYSEISYLEDLPEHMAWRRARDLCKQEIPCVLVTRALEVPASLNAVCRELSVPLLRTPLTSSILIDYLEQYLSSMLSPSTSVHGVLVDVFGVGILLLGKSGVGKSEAALDLVMRGHRLVADDIVEIRQRYASSVYGSGPDIIRHHMEIRGLGILNIKDLFGIAAVRETKKIELVVELVEWDEDEEYDRLGVDEQTYEIIGVPVKLIRLPVRPGRNMTSIIEVAARNLLLKFQGHYSAREFQERLVKAIAGTRSAPLLESDVE